MGTQLEANGRFALRTTQYLRWILPYITDYRQISTISRTKSHNLSVSRLAIVFSQSFEARC